MEISSLSVTVYIGIRYKYIVSRYSCQEGKHRESKKFPQSSDCGNFGGEEGIRTLETL